MAISTLVYAVKLSEYHERQTISWSEDDRLAVTGDKDIDVLQLSVTDSVTSSELIEFMVQPMVIFSSSSLTAKSNPWSELYTDFFITTEVRQMQLKRLWTYSSLTNEDITPVWTVALWSPPGLASDNRSVLAAVTSDHRLVLMGLTWEKGKRKWTLLADLGEQLVKYCEEEFKSQRKACAIHTDYANVDYAQMTSVATENLTWSTVIPDADGQSHCALLFATMKNGAIVTWQIQLPITGIECCRIVDRRMASTESAASSLAWTALPDNPHTGLLAVGYTDGGVDVQCYCVDPDNAPDVSPHRHTQVLHPHDDFIPVTALRWFTCKEMGSVLLGSKEHFTFALVVSVSHHGNRRSDGEGESREDWKVEVTGSCYTRLGNLMAGSGISVVRDTIILAALDRVYHLSVSGTVTEPVLTCVKEIRFELKDANWGCVSVDLSPNAVLVVALFKPMFAFNHLNEEFRPPIKVHMSPLLSPDWTTLENLLSPDKATTFSGCVTDLLEFARHILCQEPISEETVVMLTNRLTSPSFNATPLGWRVSRHLLSILKSICQNKKLTEQVDNLNRLHGEMTEHLMCHQVKQICGALHQVQGQLTHTDSTMVNTMLNWVRWSSKRSEAVGSEVISQLSSIVGEGSKDKCIVCDEDVDLTDNRIVTCPKKHIFALCCHTLAVCNSTPYRRCNTCGALALSAKVLKGVPWVGEACHSCTLCQSTLYNIMTCLRF